MHMLEVGGIAKIAENIIVISSQNFKWSKMKLNQRTERERKRKSDQKKKSCVNQWDSAC